MSRVIIYLGALCIVLSVLAGWFGAPLGLASDLAPNRAAPRVPTLARPGSTVLASANALLANHPPPPPPPLPKPPPKPPPPPPPDVGVVLKGEISAIISDAGGKLSLVLQSNTPTRHAQVLHLGDQFMDGWRLTELTRRYAVLTRRGEARRVAFY